MKGCKRAGKERGGRGRRVHWQAWTHGGMAAAGPAQWRAQPPGSGAHGNRCWRTRRVGACIRLSGGGSAPVSTGHPGAMPAPRAAARRWRATSAVLPRAARCVLASAASSTASSCTIDERDMRTACQGLPCPKCLIRQWEAARGGARITQRAPFLATHRVTGDPAPAVQRCRSGCGRLSDAGARPWTPHADTSKPQTRSRDVPRRSGGSAANRGQCSFVDLPPEMTQGHPPVFSSPRRRHRRHPGVPFRSSGAFEPATSSPCNTPNHPTCRSAWPGRSPRCARPRRSRRS